MKKITKILNTKTIYLLSIIFTSTKASAIYLETDYKALVAVSGDSIYQDSRKISSSYYPIVFANLKNKIVGQKTQFDLNFAFDKDYKMIHNFNAPATPKSILNVSLTREVIDNINLKIGYFNALGSEETIVDFNQERNFLGISTYRPTSVANEDKVYLEKSTFENNNSFGVGLETSLIHDTLRMGIAYMPKTNTSLIPQSTDYVLNPFATTQTSVNYYSEFNGLGYGLNIGNRLYQSSNNKTYSDLFYGIILDYLGFKLTARHRDGSNSLKENSAIINYDIYDYNLSYALLGGSFGIGYHKENNLSGTSHHKLTAYSTEVAYHVRSVEARVSFSKIRSNEDKSYLISLGLLLDL